MSSDPATIIAPILGGLAQSIPAALPVGLHNLLPSPASSLNLVTPAIITGTAVIIAALIPFIVPMLTGQQAQTIVISPRPPTEGIGATYVKLPS